MKKIFVITILLFITACFKGKNTGPEQVVPYDFIQNPDNILWDYTTTVMNKNKKNYDLWSGRVEIFNKSGKFFCYDSLIVTFYDKKTNQISHEVHSKKGDWLKNSDNFRAMENVVVTNREGYVLKTDTLYYEHSRDRIYSNSDVVFYTKFDILRGKSFTSNSDLSDIKVYQVRGVSHRN